jgi:hypothetical protein
VKLYVRWKYLKLLSEDNAKISGMKLIIHWEDENLANVCVK